MNVKSFLVASAAFLTVGAAASKKCQSAGFRDADGRPDDCGLYRGYEEPSRKTARTQTHPANRTTKSKATNRCDKNGLRPKGKVRSTPLNLRASQERLVIPSQKQKHPEKLMSLHRRISFFAFASALTGCVIFGQSQTAKADNSVKAVIKQQLTSDQTRLQQNSDVMNAYYDRLTAGKATPQDTETCKKAEADVLTYIKEVIEAYRKNPTNPLNALRIQGAAAAEDQMNVTDPCPTPEIYKRFGKNAFTRGNNL
ncbi:MAG: hypothetical protein HGA90_02845 [Alphaproteobacteria bacterium]|nr:hypothetical protein [Alphaproteobacteria bacterium]